MAKKKTKTKKGKTSKNKLKPHDADEELTLGQRVADMVAARMGSWPFVLLQSAFLALWVAYNIWAWRADKFDPYPFILLNLMLSFQAAYAAPIIMMSQNRHTEVDRETQRKDYELSQQANERIGKLSRQLPKLLASILDERDDEEEDVPNANEEEKK